MPSEWAVKLADKVFRSLETPGRDDSDLGQFDIDTATIAIALDLAQRRGAEKEREECAKIADRFAEISAQVEGGGVPNAERSYAASVARSLAQSQSRSIASSIRARGKATEEPKQ